MTTTGDAHGAAAAGTPGSNDATAAAAAAPTRERLSALLDGELDAADTREACRGWQLDAACRRDWHEWHVIGDVLRSDDLAVGAADDAVFLARLRVRLDREPVVLAPAALPPAAPRRRGRWLMPGAAAAGFVLVAGTFVALQTRAPDGGAGLRAGVEARDAATPVATAPTSGTPAAVLASTGPAARTAEPGTTGRLIRDARLDRYLSAHKQFAGSTMPGFSAGNLRNATVQVEGR